MSRKAMKDLKMILDLEKDTMIIGAVSPNPVEMKEAPSGHPVLSLTDYDNKANFPDKFHGFLTQEPQDSGVEGPNETHVLGRPKRRRLQKRVDGLHEAFIADEGVEKKPESDTE